MAGVRVAAVAASLCTIVALLGGCEQCTDTECQLQVQDALKGSNVGLTTAKKQCDLLQGDYCSLINPDCYYSGYNSTPGAECPLTDIPNNNQWTYVYPGGETQCIQKAEPFAFQVFHGASDKLLIYFQGGGACWDWLTTVPFHILPNDPDPGACTQRVFQQDAHGLFNRTNPLNPYRDWSIVHINYCGGDGHSGNATRDYKLNGEYVEQKGYFNARAAIDWAKRNFPGQLANFAVSGASAGSIGTQAWARTLLSEFTYDKAHVLLDSYMGVFPDGVQTGVFRDMGICSTDLLGEELIDRCNKGSITLQQILLNAMDAHPAVPFVQIQSKVDTVQQGFATVIAMTKGKQMVMTPAMFYRRVSGIARVYATRKNYNYFFVNGGQHCYTMFEDADPNPNTANMYETDTESKGGNGANGATMLYSVMSALVNQQPIANRCFGGVWDGATDVSYCDPATDPEI